MILGFAGVILLGALVLMLPIATVQRVWTLFHRDRHRGEAPPLC